MKKVKSLFLTLTFILTSITSFFAFAQKSPGVRSTNLLEAKVRLEELVSSRLRSTIATTLDKKAFDVSVQVSLIEIAKSKEIDKTVKRSAAGAETPLDLTVGLVDADAIIRKYEEEVQVLKEKQSLIVQTAAQNLNPEFAIQSIRIFIGLDQALGEEYSKEMQKWAKDRFTPEFGAALKIDVSLIKSAPDKKENPKTLFDILSSLQSLFGYLILALSLIVGILLMKIMGSKDAKEQRELAVQMQQDMKLKHETFPLLPTADSLEKEEPKNLIPTVNPFEQIKDLQSKIIWSCSLNLNELTKVFHGWLEAGEEGCYKTAALIDVLISYGGQNGVAPQDFHLQWENAIPQSFKKKMREIFESMSSLESDRKIALLEEIYWDLVSLKTLGVGSLSQPFQFVSGIPTLDVKNLLTQQNPRMRTLVVLHMSDDSRLQYLKTMNFENKKELIEQSLQMETVLSTDIEAASETLKFEVKRSVDTGGTVSMKSMLPKLLKSFSIVDEMKLLKEITQKVSDNGLSIKQSFPSLAFIHQWPEDKAKAILSQASGDEVLAFLRLMPEISEQILPLCASRVQTIVSEDLAREDQTSLEQKEKHLSSLKLRMLQLINKENIQLDVIFASVSPSNGGLRAVS